MAFGAALGVFLCTGGAVGRPASSPPDDDGHGTSRSASFWRCVDKIELSPLGSQWPGFGECQEQELDRLNEKLNNDYRSLAEAARTHGDSPAWLIEAERSWISYRDKWCAFESHNGPTDEDVTELNCKLDLTNEHLQQIDEQIDDLAHEKG